MKKLLLPLAIALTFSACKSNKSEEEKRDLLYTTDSANLQNNAFRDTAIVTPVAPAPVVITPAPQKTNTVRKTVKQKPAPVVTTPAPASTTTTTTPATGTSTAGTTTTDNTTTTPAPAKKPGISNTAKGAVIGGVAGAAAGAIIGKNAKGAIIGGVIGAAGGYIIGKKKDNKARDTTAN